MPPLTVTLAGHLTAADTAARTLSGTLLPYGVDGRTNLGRVRVPRGVVRLPESPQVLVANLDHDARRPVARATALRDTPDALEVDWTVPATPAGDQLLAEAAAQFRTGMSVELDGAVIRDGVLRAGALSGVGFVVEPAFPGARITDLLVAQDAGTEAPPDDDDDAADDGDTDSTGGGVQSPPSPDAPGGPPDTDTDDTDTDTDTPGGPAVPTPTPAPASAPADLRAQAGPRGQRLTAQLQHPQDLYRMLAQAHARNDRRLLAALTDITATDLSDTEVPQWVGELWSGIAYTRRVVGLVNTGQLTSYTVRGWRWVTKPVMAPYAGDKADVPSNAVATEPVEIAAERLAGAHDVDRKYRDFGDDAFFASYYSAMAESYARLSDQALTADLKAAATPVTPGAAPAPVSAGWAGLVDAALSIVNVGAPSFALVAADVYRSLLLTPKDQAFEFLTASMGLQDGGLSGFRVIPVPVGEPGGLDTGEILVGSRSAATFHELGGGAPIRAEALDLSRGGVDVGCFGYYATNVHDARALALVDLTADAA